MSTKNGTESVSKYPLPFSWGTSTNLWIYISVQPCQLLVISAFLAWNAAQSSALSEWPSLIGHVGTTEITIPTKCTRMYE